MSLDGAAYMRSEYVGESAYVWCCSHVLNVCMCDGTESIREARNLYGVLIHLAVFFWRFLQKGFAIRELRGQTQSWSPKVAPVAETRHHKLGIKENSYPSYLWKCISK